MKVSLPPLRRATFAYPHIDDKGGCPSRGNVGYRQAQSSREWAAEEQKNEVSNRASFFVLAML